MSTQVQALVNYYAREGFARHIHTVCSEVLRKRPNEPVQMFWKSYALIMEGSYSEVRPPSCRLLFPHQRTRTTEKRSLTGR